MRHVIMGSLERHGFAIAETDMRVSLAYGFWMVLAGARRANLRRVRCRYSGVTPACSGENLPGRCHLTQFEAENTSAGRGE